ncbi:MAG: ATP-binding protein, partial [Pseudomonadota bacterium]
IATEAIGTLGGCIRVRDNGCGMPPELIRSVLHWVEPTASSATMNPDAEEMNGGSLKLSNRMMRSIGGSIGIDSRPGRTDVTLNFPLLRQEKREGAQPTVDAPSEKK